MGGVLTATLKIGEILVENGVISETQLKYALDYQRRFGGRIGWILLSLGYINKRELYTALSQQYGIEFFSPSINELDIGLIKIFSPKEIWDNQCIPLRIEDDTLIVATSYLRENLDLRFITRKLKHKYVFNRVDLKLISDNDLQRIIQSVFHRELMDYAVSSLKRESENLSASLVISKKQKVFFLTVGTLIILSLILYPSRSSTGMFIAMQVFYLSAIAFKLFVSLAGLISSCGNKVKIGENKRDEYPVYTILLPLYREKEVIGNLISALKRLDYPQHKLDIILILEEDDYETLVSAKRYNPPYNWRFVIVPASMPKTKPKACNYGLFFARGKYVTIYDAEDIPEPDQLRLALANFEKCKGDTACLQAKLNFYNRDENLLTKLFTLEYSFWFDCMIPGLVKLGFPIPLGGTSNHFDRSKLDGVKGWDPFNTTEDADLGIRFAVKGYRVGFINSTTYEEANARLKNWVKQRSRWIKGYMQTFLVHSRNMGYLYKHTGVRGLLTLFLLIGGTPFIFLAHPFVMLFSLFVSPAFDVKTISLYTFVIGNGMGIVLHAIGLLRRGYYNLLPFSILIPLYWYLHSLSAYIALYELIKRPFYWYKTQHGISKYLKAKKEGIYYSK